jgi:hypothetical protein
MIAGRRNPATDSPPGSGIHIGGNNNAPLQNVVGDHNSHIHQTAAPQPTADAQQLHDLLAAFRTEIDRNEHQLPTAPALRGMADTVEGSLSNPHEQASVLRHAALMLPQLVAGTVVQQAGEAVANTLGSWLI